MTDPEFDVYFSGFDDKEILCKLGKYVSSVQLKNGNSYTINCTDDLWAVVEQELYEMMTGRE